MQSSLVFYWPFMFSSFFIHVSPHLPYIHFTTCQRDLKNHPDTKFYVWLHVFHAAAFLSCAHKHSRTKFHGAEKNEGDAISVCSLQIVWHSVHVRLDDRSCALPFNVYFCGSPTSPTPCRFGSVICYMEKHVALFCWVQKKSMNSGVQAAVSGALWPAFWNVEPSKRHV